MSETLDEHYEYDELNWRYGAQCGPEKEGDYYLFGPGENATYRLVRELEAKAICFGCPVITFCRTEALGLGGSAGPEEFGVWGGMGEDERRKAMRRLGSTPRVRTTELSKLLPGFVDRPVPEAPTKPDKPKPNINPVTEPEEILITGIVVAPLPIIDHTACAFSPDQLKDLMG